MEIGDCPEWHCRMWCKTQPVVWQAVIAAQHVVVFLGPDSAIRDCPTFPVPFVTVPHFDEGPFAGGLLSFETPLEEVPTAAMTPIEVARVTPVEILHAGRERFGSGVSTNRWSWFRVIANEWSRQP